MIPKTDVALTPAERARWELTKAAAALVRDHGVSPDLVMLDAREGCDHAANYLRRRKELGL
ncbi:hypothetical protein [Amycolatopsis eburnea]|uniref:Uncharacterized protein n=1 Tax=Amycolatopsis eburnea TaxID=2267691 RepID=A0A3R9E3K0_9PSEU|nr:hypothetical protein [Amycolatopsis eburnea]RSD21979.1 hypothetical protein EIY87_09180 [Amycolatopsis eburnea]